MVDNVGSFVKLITNTVEQTKDIDLKAQGISVANAINAFVDQFKQRFRNEDAEEEFENMADAMKEFNSFVKQAAKAHKNLVDMFKNGTEDLSGDNGAISIFYKNITAFVLSKDMTKKLSELDEDTMKDVVKFLKKADDAAKILMKFEKRLEGKSEVLAKTVQDFLVNTYVLQMITRPDTSIVAPLPRYMEYVNKTAKKMNELVDIINEKDITSAILKFLNDIKLFTQTDQLEERTNRSRRMLVVFGKDLLQFNKIVKLTQPNLKKFTEKMSDATEALKRFDEAILERERQRNESLKKFAELVGEIADNMGRLQKHFDNMDENKILNAFSGIKSLIASFTPGAIVSSHEDESETTRTNRQENQRSSQNQTNTREQQNQTPQNNYYMGGSGVQKMIVVNF